LGKKAHHKFWGFAGRFALIHLIIYTAIGAIFLQVQNALPASGRVGLDFFAPYSISLTGTLAQLIIGAVTALVLYPFYENIVRGKRGLFILFAALWGVALLGSLEPKVGTIEGMLYTEISFMEHLLVLAAGALQVLLFALLFLLWERRHSVVRGIGQEPAEERRPAKSGGRSGAWGYAVRFTLLHLLIYIIVGMFFYQLSGYEEALATMEEFALWRDLENMVMPLVIFGGQIIRGGILAFFLYPFYSTYMQQRRGWLLLFGLLFGLKVLATVISVPATVDELIYGLQTITTGLPEITAQTLVFAAAFFCWERKRYKKLQRRVEDVGK